MERKIKKKRKSSQLNITTMLFIDLISITLENILPCKLLKLEKKELLKNYHAQTKPKIISRTILT